MATKTQTELEQPAKVYQVVAVETKIDHALKQLDTIVAQTGGLVSTAQLAEARAANSKEIADAVMSIDLKYGPLKRQQAAILGTLVTAVILQLVYIAFNLFGGSSKT